MEKKREVKFKAYMIDLYCDNCGELMHVTGERHLLDHIRYMYACAACGEQTNSTRKYPCLVYETVETEAA